MRSRVVRIGREDAIPESSFDSRHVLPLTFSTSGAVFAHAAMFEALAAKVFLLPSSSSMFADGVRGGDVGQFTTRASTVAKTKFRNILYETPKKLKTCHYWAVDIVPHVVLGGPVQDAEGTHCRRG